MSIEERAEEIATFLGLPIDQCRHRLSQGFGVQHNAVNEDFRHFDPQNDADLLRWYATTENYIWELSAYHEDAGFNYSGMVGGIVERLRSEPNVHRVLCLGDGIGDLSMALSRAGFDTWYHDLSGSKTEAFARYRFAKYGVGMNFDCTLGWMPRVYGMYDAIISLDFLEHLTEVMAWTAVITKHIRSGGLLSTQNAFACGSDGAIPCHLKVNDIFAYAITAEGELEGYPRKLSEPPDDPPDQKWEDIKAEWRRLIAAYAPNGTRGMAFWDWVLIEYPGGFTRVSSNWYRRE
jgi:hypothetical protein